MWSFRGNACDIPTDCPHRERAGWTGDWQLYAPTATFLYDVAGFSAKWLRDLAAGQRETARLGFGPEPGPSGLLPVTTLDGSAGLGRRHAARAVGDVQEYGDMRILADCGRRWSAGSTAPADGRRRAHPDRVARPRARPARAVPLGHRLPLGRVARDRRRPQDFPAFIAADKSDVATAYLRLRSTAHARPDRDAARPGRQPPRYAELSAGARRVAHRVLDADGRVDAVHAGEPGSGRCAFGLVPDALPPAGRRRARRPGTGGRHPPGTGFLATPGLLPALADDGHLDLAYEVLFQDTEPSWWRWSTAVRRRCGAWRGIDEDGVPHESLNDDSKGAGGISFLGTPVCRRPAAAEPTWRRFRRIRPAAGSTRASAGNRPGWDRFRGVGKLGGAAGGDRDVPPGCVAEVVLPDGTSEVGRGTKRSVDPASVACASLTGPTVPGGGRWPCPTSW